MNEEQIKENWDYIVRGIKNGSIDKSFDLFKLCLDASFRKGEGEGIKKVGKRLGV